ncbi:uncharacterized protein LOC119080241 [Bradysia coprophila]|uniref:uncharacterized protein LOC119080241 n=1 Tax=Bradysia coprophila TaxID=38358 RepID=UPI00187D82A4|nr:uncharacterized protein LOC119080241 [Bradysia coprophila]
MESDQNQVHLTTPVSCNDKELNCVSSPLNHDAKSPTMLENMSDMEDDGSLNVILRREDATESKMDEMMDKLLEILDETITILDADVDEDDNSGYYVLSDPKGQNETVALGDAIIAKENSQNNHTVGCQTEAEGENITSAVSKNQNDGTSCELNELTESLMIVLMLFSLYFLLSSMV